MMPIDSDRAEHVAKDLGGARARKSGSGWVTLCPAHDDRNPSLSITEGDDGRLLLRCHAGCSQEAVIEAVARKGVRIGPPRNGARGPADDGGNIASLQRK